MKYCSCPNCGKAIVRLEPYEDNIYEYWCDVCDLDISMSFNTPAHPSVLLKERKDTK